MRYASYAQICVYLDISKELPASIKFSWHNEEWIQDIDYEHIPFRCQKCHEYGHLFHECPQNHMQSSSPNLAREKDVEGFKKVGNKQQMTKRQPILESQPKTQPANRYEILNTIMEEGEGSEARKSQEEQPNEVSKKVSMK